MHAFEYANPVTVQEAASLLSAKPGESEILAGGTDLLALMKEGLHTPRLVVNLKNVKELEGIRKTSAGLRIGALVTIDELAKHADVKSAYQAISDAAAAIPSPQIRHMGTAGGDLCQRPRCWYFRNGFGLLAMKDGSSLVPEGANQYHAIFGAGPAYFVSASSLGPALIALGARVKLVSSTGTREIPVASFFVAPSSTGAREIALRPDEILTEILVPAAAVKSATYEVRQKDALDWPLATASVVLHMKGNAVSSAKVVLGHVAAKPWDAVQAAQALVGKPVTSDSAEAAGKAAVADAKPLSQNAYKVTLARVAVKRALLDAAKQKG